MSMPIQRQSEQYSVFDDGPRFARDRSSTDLPKGLAHLINTSGPRIQAGLLNTREAAGYDFGRGPRDHGGHGPDGGPSVPDWYYEDDNDNDGDPEDPPGTPMEDPWGHHAGSRRPFDRAASGRLAACLECGDDVLPREGDWEHVNGPSDHLADPDEDDIANDEYGEGLDPARGMDAYKQRREMMGRRIVAFDWKQIPEEHLGDSNAKDQWHAPLENGHALWVYGHGDQPWTGTGEGGYIAALDNLPYDPDFPEDSDGENNWLYHVREEATSGKLKKFPTREHAMRAAEEAYQKHFPIGTNTGGHDSGTDYSDLNSFDLNAPIDESKFSPYDPTDRGPRLALMDPTQMQVPLGGGYQPAHRVGLPWRDQVIPGTVIGLDGPNVNVRWDDGQYSIEEPHNIQLL